MKKLLWYVLLLVGVVGLSSCQINTAKTPATTVKSAPTRALETFSYSTQIPSPTATRSAEGTAEPVLPTPTPFKYLIQKNDTLSGIAFQFGVLLDRLIAANPSLNPNFLVPGEELIIPSSEGAIISYPTPTPITLNIDFETCLRSLEGGLWCFPIVTNSQPSTVENVSVILTLRNPETEEVFSQTAVPPLNYIAPGESIPAAAFFPAPIPSNYQISSRLETALVSDNPPPAVDLSTPEVKFTSGEMSAEISGVIQLPENLEGIQSIWIAAVGYNEDSVVGFRKWVSSGILVPGTDIPYQMTLYSLGDGLDQVEVLAEFH